MSIESIKALENKAVAEAIESRNTKIEECRREIRILQNQIEQLEKNPKICITLKEIQSVSKGNNIRMRLLKNLINGVGSDESYERLYEVAGLTEKKLMKRHEFGKEMLKELKALLKEFGLELTK